VKNNKSLGQHWLKNRAILDEIADAAAMGADENTVCLEIGPGLGTLTSSLLKRFHKVIAVLGSLDSLEWEPNYNGAVFAAVECRSGHKVVLFVSHESAASFGVGGIK